MIVRQFQSFILSLNLQIVGLPVIVPERSRSISTTVKNRDIVIA
jgi:hypothetical protein